MQVIWCKTWWVNIKLQLTGRSNSHCDHKSCLNHDVSIVPLLNWKKIESHFETWSSDAQRINLTFVVYSFVANFVRYISAKYYWNWFSFHTVIMKVLGVNFFLKHSVDAVSHKNIIPWLWYAYQQVENHMVALMSSVPIKLKDCSRSHKVTLNKC